MNLRTRFMLLIVGGAVIPPVMFAVASFVLSVAGVTHDGGGSMFVMRRIVGEIKSGEATIQSLTTRMDERGPQPGDGGPEVTAIVIVGADGTVRYPADRAGERLDALALLDASPDGEVSGFGAVAIPDEEGGTGYFVASYSAATVLRQVMGIGFFVPLAFLLFTAIMSVFIIRSIDRSINSLEIATRRIADGDLDFQLETRGRGSIASLTRSFDTMRSQLRDQFDRNARFLMGLSHDLKTPLSSIVGYVEAIRDGHADTGEKLERYTAIIRAKASLLESRITALIDHAKQETREWEASLEPVELKGFLEEFAEIAEVEAVAKGHRFARSIDIQRSLAVRMDAGMVTRALENLLDNAFRYAREGGRVGLDAHRSADSVSVTVSNEGDGIREEDLPHIFEPLYRASRDRNSPGFGLGLSTVRSVMTSHGWSIDVRSTPGTQTRFEILIPLREFPATPGYTGRS